MDGGLSMKKEMNQTYIDNQLTYCLSELVKAEDDIRYYNSALGHLYKIFKYPRHWNKELSLKLQVVNQYLIYWHLRYDLFDDFIRTRIDWVLALKYEK